MYPKLQSQGLAGGPNTGSCAAYAYYLEHENNWKKKKGHRKDIIPFYDQDGDAVSVGTVINTIDANKLGLHVDDAKFYSLVINPSEKEAATLGATREERLESIREMVDKMMDRYAVGFGKEQIKSHNDLLYFYTIHEYREDEEGNLRPGIHVHIIVSRKDLNGQFKLSPMTNHRGETAGVIKSGFNRDAFYRDCESIFDNAFNYQRRIIESYDYLNTLSHGSDAEKTAMIRAAVKEEKICENVTAALARRASRLAEEAASAEAKRQREEELARMDADKKKRNEFWNSYHSYYKPTLEELNKQCKATFSLYRDLKDQRIDVQADIDEQYLRLKHINSIIHQKHQQMYDAKMHKDLVTAFALMVASANPIAALLVGLVLLIAIDAKNLENKEDVRALRQRADEIRKGIEALRDKQEKLRFAQQDSLRQYIQVKDEKEELNVKLQEFRNELEPKKEAISQDSQAKDIAKRKEAPKDPLASQALHALGIYGQLMSAETRLDLDLELLTVNTVIEPVFHPNGGVADLHIIANNEKVLASTTCSDEKLTAMLDKWCELTEQTPAHRITSKSKTNINPTTKQQPKQKKQSTNNIKI
jgi:hypothetical protein